MRLFKIITILLVTALAPFLTYAYFDFDAEYHDYLYTHNSATPQVLGTTTTLLTKELSLGMVDPQVQVLQQFLNEHGFTVAATGPGSRGQETTHFGPATQAALIRYQEAYAQDILWPQGITKGTGLVYQGTRNHINARMKTTTITPTNSTTPGFSIGTSDAYVNPRARLTLTAQGGVAPYSWWATNGILRPSPLGKTATFIAPRRNGTTTITSTDSLNHTATILLTTVSKLTHRSVTTKPSRTITLHPTGGMKPYTYALIEGGGTLTTTGRYTAPAATGTAAVRITDAVGQTRVVHIGIGTKPAPTTPTTTVPTTPVPTSPTTPTTPGTPTSPATTTVSTTPVTPTTPSTPVDTVFSRPLAKIVIDEPAWYTDTTVNQCDPTRKWCYFPDLGMSQTKGYAPFGVFFQGGESSPRENIADWSWDFGTGSEQDPHGRTMHGMNAVHVFETPGTYRVTLTVKDAEGRTSVDTISVTVMPPSGVTYYIDSSIGNDTCSGTSATPVSSTECPWKTATKAFAQMIKPTDATGGRALYSEWNYKPGDRILFKRGQVFDVLPMTISHGWGTQGYSFGAYGDTSAPKPIIQYVGTSSSPLIGVPGYGLGYISFSDLQFNLRGPVAQSSSVFFTNAATKNILFLRNDFYEPQNGAVGISGDGQTQKLASNIFLIDNTFQHKTTNSTSVTLVYAFGAYNYALLGNSFDQAGNHISYNSDLHNVVIAENVFNRPAFGRTALRITDGEDMSITDNSFLGWIDPISGTSAHNGGGKRYNYSLVELSPNGGSKEYNLRNIIFERNVLTNFETGLKVVNAGETTVRNNIFVSPAHYPAASFVQLSQAPGIDLSRPLTNVKIVGNTFLSNGVDSGTTPGGDAFIKVFPWTAASTQWGNNHKNIVVSNNIFSAVQGSSIRAVNLLGTENNLLSALDSNSNLVFIPSAPNGSMYKIGSAVYSLAEWKTATGKDSSTSVTDPRFVGPITSVAYQPGNPSAIGNLSAAHAYTQALRLQSSSLRGTGAVLGADSYYDFNQNARFATDNTIDIGALEYR